MRPILCCAILASFACGCTALAPSKGGGQVIPSASRRVNPADIAVPPGYRVEVVATGLNFPTGVAFDDQNRPCVTEAGYSYGEVFTTPRLVRIEPGGRLAPIATGSPEAGPWNGVDFRDGAFFVAEGGEKSGGRISRIDANGTITPIVRNLPSLGDHHTNGPVVSADGYVYFGVGTATNSGIVGEDNFHYGWLKRFPDFHDVPARDVKLVGHNVTTDNPVTAEQGDTATTGAYVPFGTPTQPGQVINGRMPCNGAVMRVRATGGEPELVAWGMRNPYGLAFDAEGKLLVAENQFDDRGSRPVWGAGDLLWRIDRPGLWYGWPDFHGDRPLAWKDHYQPHGKDAPRPLLAERPNDPPAPAAVLGVHASACGLDVSRTDAFGFAGQAMVALFGDMAPEVGKVLEPVGYAVVRVDPSSGVIESFAVNRGGKTNGPASKLKTGGLERPIAARFDRTGTALYVVDFGQLAITPTGPTPVQKTGVLWRITREAAR